MGPGSWRPLQNGMRCSGRGLAEPGGQGNNRLTTISRPRAPQGNRAGWPREPQSGPTLGPRCCPLWPDPLLPSRLMDSTCPSSEADKVGPTCTFCPDLLPSLSQPHPLANSRGTTSFVLREGAASPGHPRKPVSEEAPPDGQRAWGRPRGQSAAPRGQGQSLGNDSLAACLRTEVMRERGRGPRRG